MKSYTSKILSGLAIAGVFGTAVTIAIATKKAVKKLIESYDSNYLYKDRVKDPKERIKLTWKYYIIPITIAGGTIGCIIASEHANAKIIAATSASFAILKKSYDKYGKAIEKAFGIDGANIVRKELVNMGENKNEFMPVEDQEVYWIGYGYDDYFLSTPEEIELAEAELNKRLHKGLPVSMADFMEMLNLSPSAESVAMGWSRYELADEDDEWIEIVLNTIDSDGDHPACELEFSSRPTTAFEEHHKWFCRGEPTDRTMPINDEPPFDMV